MAQTVSPAMTRKAEELAERIPLLTRGRSKRTGEEFVLVPGSKPGLAYYTTSYGCTCIGFDKRGTCTHQMAVSIAAERASRLEVRVTAPQSVVDGADDARVYLMELIEQRAHVGRIVAAEGGRAIEDPRCLALDEQIARLRATLAPISFREVAA